MFFLSSSELNKWITQLRQYTSSNPISEELRGWNWDKAPVQPPTRKILIGVSELATRYCPTYRDIYLKKIANVEYKPTQQMIEGLAIHLTSQRVVTLVKRYIYQNGVVDGPKLILDLNSLCTDNCGKIINELAQQHDLDSSSQESMLRKIEQFYRFLVVQAGARLDQAASRFPHSDVDSIISNMLLPVVEKKVDGSLIGLSKELSVDMCSDGSVLVDIKTGEQKAFHKYSLAGYALAIECESGFEVNYGLIVYVRIVDGKSVPSISFNPFVISDELRREFLEMRDEAFAVLNLAKDPGLPDSCPLSCVYYTTCHPSSSQEKVGVLEAHSK